jgi:hypothetical protein
MQRTVGDEDMERPTLSVGDGVLVAGSAIVLLSLLLPWWNDGFGNSANGFHDWGWMSFVSLLLVAALLVVRNVPEMRRLPELALSDPAAYIVGGAAELVGAVVFWLTNNSRLMGGVKYGVFVCVVGGAVTVAGGYVKHLESHQP